MRPSILLTGGMGTLGGHVAPLLREAGHQLRILTRGSRTSEQPGIEYVTGDLRKGAGIEPAVDGIETIVHLAGGPRGDDVATRDLVRAAARTGVQHIVYISVIGADRVPLGYFRAKLEAERVIAESGIPYSTLRAAQFHDLVLAVVFNLTQQPAITVPCGATAAGLPVGLQIIGPRHADERVLGAAAAYQEAST